MRWILFPIPYRTIIPYPVLCTIDETMDMNLLVSLIPTLAKKIQVG